MIAHFRRAIQDIRRNRFLSGVTVVTIALAVVIVGAFSLFFINASDLMTGWKQGIRVMVYLVPGLSQDRNAELNRQLSAMAGVQEARFISRQQALELLREQMKRQVSLLDGLEENPLPDAFELRLVPHFQTLEKIEDLARNLEALPEVEEVEYGQKWLGRFTGVFDLFRFTGYGLGGLFFAAAVFIVANTTRIMLYSRKEEVHIMRLVGATDGFIKAPFYVEGLFQGILGGLMGLAALWVMFGFVSSRMQQGLAAGLLSPRFLPPVGVCAILGFSMLAGWLGCLLSLRPFFKD